MMDGMVERIGVFALVGLASGFASGLFGIGGGIVRIPLFVYLLPLFGVAHSVIDARGDVHGAGAAERDRFNAQAARAR